MIPGGPAAMPAGGRELAAAYARASVPGSSGAILTCWHTAVDGARPSVLIALPFGVPGTVTRAAFDALGPVFNVVTWESRYLLNLDEPFSGGEALSPAEHAADMRCVLNALGIARCTLIGYCSGAGISLVAARQHPDVFGELILVSGEYQLFKRGHAATAYQRSIDTFLPVVATSRQQAGAIFARMSEISSLSRSDAQSELEHQMNLPFSSEERLFRYARNYMAYRDFDALVAARDVRQPTFVLSGERDVHAGTENSEAVRGAIPGATMFIDRDADHYAFCRHGSRILEAITAHLTRGRAAAAT
ncbi:MAG TPA: alpha/beta hydrolase [Kofleriaceae bacterium]